MDKDKETEMNSLVLETLTWWEFEKDRFKKTPKFVKTAQSIFEKHIKKEVIGEEGKKGVLYFETHKKRIEPKEWKAYRDKIKKS